MSTKKANRYEKLIKEIFLRGYRKDAKEIPFTKTEFETTAKKLQIVLPKNVPDVIYSFRYRTDFPQAITTTAPRGQEWIIRGAGKGLYRFALVRKMSFAPIEGYAETKILDATPGVIIRYAFDDEQALLAKVRFNRLIDIFTGLACYSLQNHLRTSVTNIGQVETDEIYVGIDKRGAQYILPVQAKGGKDKLGRVQIEQDFALCKQKFPSLICKPIAAQFLPDGAIVLMELEQTGEDIVRVSEKHYRLVPSDQLSEDELATYAARQLD